MPDTETQKTDAQKQEEARLALITALRQMADAYEQHPEMPFSQYGTYLWVHDCSKEQLAAVTRAFPYCGKSYTDDSFSLRVELGKHGEYESPALNLRFQTSREQVCERVVVGTREVPEEVVPAYTRPAHTEEIVEWKCKPLLAGEEE